MKRWCWSCGEPVTTPPCPRCGDRRTISEADAQRLTLAHLRRPKLDSRRRPGV